MDLEQYIRPDLMIVAVVLYLLGVGMKKSRLVADRYIPLVNGVCGILICGLEVFASGEFAGAVLMGIFTAVTQGILAAGLSTYVHQVQKQIREKK